jgi:hypothetical protein
MATGTKRTTRNNDGKKSASIAASTGNVDGTNVDVVATSVNTTNVDVVATNVKPTNVAEVNNDDNNANAVLDIATATATTAATATATERTSAQDMASAMAPPAGLSTAINETDARSELVAKGNDIIDVEEDDDEERDDDGPVDVLVKVTSGHIIFFFNYSDSDNKLFKT